MREFTGEHVGHSEGEKEKKHEHPRNVHVPTRLGSIESKRLQSVVPPLSHDLFSVFLTEELQIFIDIFFIFSLFET